MTFETDYQLIETFAKAQIKYFKLEVAPEDLINDAYLKIAESGNKYSLNSCKKIINDHCYEIKNHQKITVPISDVNYGKKYLFVETQKQCKTCKEQKPLAAFHKSVRESLGVSYRCKECYNAAERILNNKNKEKVNKKNRQAYQLKKRRRLLEKVNPIALQNVADFANTTIAAYHHIYDI